MLTLRSQDKKALGCVAFVVGGALSIFIPVFFIGAKIYSDTAWIIFMPGWIIFRPGRDDAGQILAATVFDTLVFAMLIYAVVYAIASFFQRAKNG